MSGGGVARLGDMIEAICNHPSHPTKKVTGFFTALGTDPTNLTDGIPTVQLGSIVVCDCGHSAIVSAASLNYTTSNIAVARLGDPVIPTPGPLGPTGTIVTSSGKTTNFDPPLPPPRVVTPAVAKVVPPPIIQPAATEYDVVTQYIQEEDIPPNNDGTGTTPARDADADDAMEAVGVDESPLVAPTLSDATAAVAPPAIVADDFVVPDVPQGTLLLSPRYNLASLTSHTGFYNCDLVEQTVSGVTYDIPTLVANLQKLAVHLLEPISDQFGKPIVTSAFRTKRNSADTSNHCKGFAADLQFAGFTDLQYYQTAIYIRDNLLWAELILEYGGNRPWIHVAYNENSLNRTKFLTCKTVGKKGQKAVYQTGIHLYVNVPKVGGR